MPEHRIRLRGPWDWWPFAVDIEAPRRLDLPVDWPIVPDAPFRLRRRFGRPSMTLPNVPIRLEMLEVPGLEVVRLNARRLGPLECSWSRWILPLSDPLLPRNDLVLEVDPSAWTQPPRGWGEVALVIGGSSANPDTERPGVS